MTGLAPCPSKSMRAGILLVRVYRFEVIRELVVLGDVDEVGVVGEAQLLEEDAQSS